MPSNTNSNNDKRLAVEVAGLLKIHYLTMPIDEIIKSFQKTTKCFKDKKNLGNLKARVRMSLLYGKASEINGLVLGTGNKTELLVGYFTKYGDGGVDILPIGDLRKSEVKELAQFLNIPQKIIDRPPTAGLWAGQTDEAELGISYAELDKILEAIENKNSLRKFNKLNVKLVKNYIKNSEHKRMMPAICKIK